MHVSSDGWNGGETVALSPSAYLTIALSFSKGEEG